MKKTLTTVALVTSTMLPLSNTSNAKSETDLQDLSNLKSNISDDSIQIKKNSQLVTITKKNAFLVDEYGNNIKTLELGDKLQVLKKYEDAPFYKVNYNGQALFIANEAVDPNLELNHSETSIKMNSNAEIISLSSEKVNVYSGDSKVSNILFTLDKGIYVDVIEKTNNDWYKINYYGNTGFVSSNDIHINSNIPTQTFSLEKASTTRTGVVFNLNSSKLNVRKKPNTNSTIITKLSNGDKVTILEDSGNWYKISINNGVGYVSKNYIKETQNSSTPVDTTKYIVINTAINLRTSDSWSGTVDSVAPVGSTLEVIEINGDWAKVYKDGKTLYAPVNHLKKDESSKVNTTKYTVINGAINLRTSGSWSGEIYKTVNIGTTLDVVEITGVWATIYYDNKVLYAPASYLQSTEAVPPVIEDIKPSFTETDFFMDGVVYNVSLDSLLNVRKEPFADSEIIDKLKNDTRVNVIAVTSNDWYKVDINGTVGYVSKKYIKEYVPETTKYTVVDTPINLRKDPSWSGEVVEKVLAGTTLDVIEINGEWATVYKNKETLYAPSKYLSNGSKPPVIEEEVKPSFTETDFFMDGVVYNVSLDNSLNIRKEPFTNSEIIGYLKNDTRVNVIAVTSNDWYKVDINGTVGYVSKKYIKEYVPETTKYTVVDTPINLRKDPSWSGEVVEKVLVGTTLDIIEINGEWATVYKNKETLYAPSRYLSDGSKPPVTDGEITPPNTDTIPPTVDEDKKEDVAPPATEDNKPSEEENTPSFTVTDMKMHGVVYNVASNDVLNVRETPSYNGKLITTLKNNERVTIIGLTSTNWYKVDINGTIGYVNKSYIKEYVPQTTKYEVVTSSINLRKTASWDAETVEVISVGNIVDVVEINGEWATIYRNKDFFYAPAKYLDNNELANITYTKYPSSLSSYIKTQASKTPSYSEAELEEYINPLKCNKFEFLTLNKYREIDVNKLDKMLISQNAGVLIGQGQTIANVSKKYSLDPVYFLAQSIHETGYGKSTLAKGVTITEIADENSPIKDSNGNITGYKMIQLDAPVTVYNLYGIGAYDNLPTMPNRALILGTTYAYNHGWTSVEKALDGAGAFLSSNYINSSKYNQNTLYKMRYNPNSKYIWHQYATTPWYSRYIAKFMDKHQYLYINNDFSFDKPLFTDMSEYSLNDISLRSISEFNDFTLPAKEDITL